MLCTIVYASGHYGGTGCVSKTVAWAGLDRGVPPAGTYHKALSLRLAIGTAGSGSGDNRGLVFEDREKIASRTGQGPSWPFRREACARLRRLLVAGGCAWMSQGSGIRARKECPTRHVAKSTDVFSLPHNP